MNFYIIIYKGSLKGESGEPCNNKYDLQNACKTCGTGAQLIGNLITKGLSSTKMDFFETEDYDTLLSDKLFEFLINKNIKLDSLLKAIDSKGKETNFYHLTSKLYFPKATDKTTGLTTERQCVICKRDGYFNEVIHVDTSEGKKKIFPPLRLVYESVKKDFLDSSDIFNTWECYGSSNLKAEGIKVIRYARPWVIVSERIKQAFEEYGVKNVKFEEVIIN